VKLAEQQYYVYILANKGRMLYTGITNDLERRVWQHKNHQTEGYTKKYNITTLVYYEATNDVLGAIARENRLKVGCEKRK
jgi:putative endonuclease